MLRLVSFCLLCGALAYAIGHFWLEPLWGWALCSLIFLLGMLWQQFQALRLDHWLRQHEALAQTPRLHGVWQDLAERMRRALRLHEQQAQASHDRLQNFLAAVQASPNGITLLDNQGRIEWCNETASHQLGLDPQRDRMQHVVHLVRDPVFARYFSQPDPKGEVVMDGRTASIAQSMKLSVQMHPYGEGQQLMLTCDITARSQAEQMRRDFVANVSHEIRTPLTVLTGFIETLQAIPLEMEERQHYLDMMGKQAHRMQSLVSDLLTLSQLEGSPAPSVHEAVPIEPLLRQLATDAQALSAVNSGDGVGPAHHIHWALDAPSHLMGARSELLSAFSNLVNNAVRYTEPGGEIHIGWRIHADGCGVFSVKDTGPGIAPEHLPRLSERFYRVDRSRSRETGGTGLGLAIAKHVAYRHGGDLRIQSKEGVGSTFELWFPPGRLSRDPAVTSS